MPQPSSRPAPGRQTVPWLAALLAGTVFTLASAATNLNHAVSKALTLQEAAIWGAVAVAASVAMAVMPTAFFRAAGARQWGAALACLAALMMFGTFSVLAALASASGGRTVAGLAAADAGAARKSAAATIEERSRELAAIGATRLAGELRAEIETLSSSRRDLNNCEGWLPSANARQACAAIQVLRGELARAERKVKIEAEITEARRTLAVQSSKLTVANADAEAVVGYAAALGVNATVDTVNKIATLVTVFVVEFGGGLSFAAASVLGRSAPPALPRGNTGVQAPVQGVQPEPERLVVPEAPAERFLQLLAERGGELFGGQRTMAQAVGVSVGTMSAVLKELSDAGRIHVAASSAGTVVRLAVAA